MNRRWLMAAAIAILFSVVCLVSAELAEHSVKMLSVPDGKAAPEKTEENVLPAAKSPVPEKKPLITITHETEESAEEIQPKESALPQMEDHVTDSLPILAIVIDDCGYSTNITSRILDLGLTATWAVIPNAPRGKAVADMAALHGQPYILHIPMQAMNDPENAEGNMVTVKTTEKEISAVLHSLRKNFPDALGANNHRGSKATSDAETMNRFMKEYAKTGWGFLDSRTFAKSIAKKYAEVYYIPVARNEVFIDGTPDLNTMKQQFAKALNAARKNGSAAAICHAREKTMPFLSYLSTVNTPDVRLVTLDEVWKRRSAVKEEKQ